MIETVEEGITLVGTAHVSKRSVADVETAIREGKPDRVLIELDKARFDAVQDPDRWKKMDIIQIIREKKQHLFLVQLYLANMQARIGNETGSAPGAEMLRAVEVADEVGAEVVLIDRDVTITLKRGFGAMGFWQRTRLAWNLFLDALPDDRADGEKDSEVDIDALLEQDALTTMTDEFARFAPVIKTALIDERDEYMASHIRDESAKGSLVAVVGAGHMHGIKRHLAERTEIDRNSLDELPKKRIFTVGKLFGYGIPLGVLASFGWLLYNGRLEELKEVGLYWLIANGGLSALGALLARGHILSALTAFVAAPLTSLSPALAAGWFAGLAEAKLHTPTVADFEAIKGLETMKEFWKNGVIRVLFVTALANLGSVIGTYIGLAEILRTLGS